MARSYSQNEVGRYELDDKYHHETRARSESHPCRDDSQRACDPTQRAPANHRWPDIVEPHGHQAEGIYGQPVGSAKLVDLGSTRGQGAVLARPGDSRADERK